MVLVGLESSKQESLVLSDYVHAQNILFCAEVDKDSLLERIAHTLAPACNLKFQEVLRSFQEREQIVSTGLGMGVAMPHARITGQKEFSILIALNSVGLKWNAIDQQDVHIIFAIIGPDDKQIEHLQIISQFAELIRDNYIRELLLTAKNKEQVLSALRLEKN